MNLEDTGANLASNMKWLDVFKLVSLGAISGFQRGITKNFVTEIVVLLKDLHAGV